MAKYSIGLDFGTLSGRALLLNLETGEELASAVCDYPHGVMDREMPWGEKLPPDWALQHPEDYLEVLYRTIPAVLKESGVPPEDIVGVGTDFTACTALPVRKDGVPLCFLPEFAQNPHAYVKLWKHHAAQDKADRITALARLRGLFTSCGKTFAQMERGAGRLAEKTGGEKSSVKTELRGLKPAPEGQRRQAARKEQAR